MAKMKPSLEFRVVREIQGNILDLNNTGYWNLEIKKSTFGPFYKWETVCYCLCGGDVIASKKEAMGVFCTYLIKEHSLGV